MSFGPRDLLRSRFLFKVCIGVIAITCLYSLFIWDISTNPPGFYVDESCLAYNGYLIAKTGASEDGTNFPLFVQCFTEGYSIYASAAHPYALAFLYLFVSPSVLSARMFAAACVLAAILLLGLLSTRISGKTSVGIIIVLTGMATPWLFECGRLVLELFVLIFGIALFLLVLFRAYSRARWRFIDIFSIAFSLALITYSYSGGRVLGPMFALGLLIFAVNRKAMIDVFMTWALYAASLIPFIVVYFTKGNIITARFRQVTYLSLGKPILTNVTEFLSAFFLDISPIFILIKGDPINRHHVQGMGEILAATFLLSLLGLFIVLSRHRSNAWWRFIIYGTLVSILPGAIASHRHHMPRLVGLPIFLLILAVPSLSSLIGDDENSLLSNRTARRLVLISLLALTLVQAVIFQMQYRKTGPYRLVDFDVNYAIGLDKALAETSRPIYLQDGFFGPSYIHAYWLGTIKGVDPNNFVHMSYGESPPPNSLVLSSDRKCTRCNVIFQDSGVIVYRAWGQTPSESTSPSDPRIILPVVIGKQGAEREQFSKPYSVGSDIKGNFYVADTLNRRIKIYDSYADFTSFVGTRGTGPGELMSPTGVVVDPDGYIYVTDVTNHKLLKYDSEGNFIKEWGGSNPSFYGPRDMAIGPNNNLYILDSGRSRVVKFDPVSETFTSWGVIGSGEGEFAGATGITIADDLVVVVDTGNKRIQIFDLEGNFLRQWSVPGWDERPPKYPDVAFDDQSKVLYVSNEPKKDIIAFDLSGRPAAGIKLDGEEQFNTPSAMTIIDARGRRFLVVVDSELSKVFVFEIGKIGNKKPPDG